MIIRRSSIAVSMAALIVVGCTAQVATPPQQAPATARTLDTGIRYVRDSEEYATLARQMYRLATEAVTRAASAQSSNRGWAVVLDIDETTLDNSTYQVERAGQPYDEPSWNAWVNRRQAPAVPGVVDFIAAARRAGAHIAWITNRTGVLETATRDNLKSVGLWNDDDRLCTQTSSSRTKRVRRTEVISGQGECAWRGRPTPVVAFIGDQLVDFPERDENMPNAGTDAAFGKTCFLLPNSMYGGWVTKPTRTRTER